MRGSFLFLFYIFIIISTRLIALVRPFYTWIFIMLNNNLLVSTFIMEVYGSYEHLP